MASTITLQNTVDYSRTFTRLVPIVGVGGFSNQPALTIANNVLQEMLSPPFNWKFNRASVDSFVTVDEQQEYTLTDVDDIGWLERCYAEDDENTSSVKPTRDIEVVQDLQVESMQGEPIKLCIDREENGDSIVRVWPRPYSMIWRIYIDYQMKAPLKSSLSNTWAPFPDELSYVYQQGFLAMALKHAEDPRYESEYQKFQMMMFKALGQKDAELNSQTVFPDRPLLIG